MFGCLNIFHKSSSLPKKLYVFKYHHICQGDYPVHTCIAYDWVEAVNSLLGKEANQNIYIDSVDIDNI